MAGLKKRGVIPRQLGKRLGQFLKPAVIGEAAVPDRRVGAKDDFQAFRAFVGRMAIRESALTAGVTVASALKAVPLTRPASSAVSPGSSKSPGRLCRFQ